MRTALSRILPFLPAALLLLFAEWSGTLWYGAQALPTTIGWLAVGTVCLLARRRASDPFDLGGPAAWLPLLLVAGVALSMALSPVARAGMTGVLVLPLLVGLPAAFASCWRSERERSLGIFSIVVVVAVVALHATVARLLMGTDRAALPLGHHNLLALWLVLLLPTALVPALEPGGRRWVAVAAAAAGVVALGLSGSLAGLIGFVVEIAVLVVAIRGLLGEGRSRLGRLLLPGLAVGGLVALAAATPRLIDMLRGQDASLLARLGYLAGALRGFAERPLVGWGPGSGAWLLAEHSRPVPGVHPPYEVVTDAHSFWADSLFELGIVGVAALIVIVALFVVRRLAEIREHHGRQAGVDGESGRPVNPEAARRWAGVASVLGSAVCLLVAGTFDVSALAIAATVPLALGLRSEEQVRSVSGSGSAWFPWAIVACLVALAPSRIGHWHFDRFLELGSSLATSSASSNESEAAAGGTVEAGLARARAEASPSRDAGAATPGELRAFRPRVPPLPVPPGARVLDRGEPDRGSAIGGVGRARSRGLLADRGGSCRTGGPARFGRGARARV